MHIRTGGLRWYFSLDVTAIKLRDVHAGDSLCIGVLVYSCIRVFEIIPLGSSPAFNRTSFFFFRYLLVLRRVLYNALIRCKISQKIKIISNHPFAISSSIIWFIHINWEFVWKFENGKCFWRIWSRNRGWKTFSR